jgi:hypothetical protein
MVKAVFLMLFGIIFSFIAVSTPKIMDIQDTKILQIFEDEGWDFLKYYPTAPIVGMGCLEKYYTGIYPSEVTFDPLNFEDTLQTMVIVGNFSFLPVN